MEKTTLNVQGMSCAHCVKSIEDSVGKLDGVDQVSVSLEHAQVKVSFNDSKVSLDKIKETIDGQGFEVN